ncbi:MAG: alanine racemase [Clostridia bacterium]|nr:alanine racemase [Clostridia bacterium]
MEKLKIRTAAYINLSNLRHNYNTIKSTVGENVKIFPVIKADAYGHGALNFAAEYEKLGASMFAVACLDEAVSLRKGGTKLPILVLGVTLPGYADTLCEYDIVQTVHSLEYARQLSANLSLSNRLKVHIKVDSGMHRLGFSPCQHEQALEVGKLKGLEVCGIFTHYAESDNLKTEFTKEQTEKFNYMASFFGKDIIKHSSNSAATLCHGDKHFDGVRPGLILYGEYPSEQIKCEFEKTGKSLKPVMTFCAGIVNIFGVKKGESVGYSRTFYAPYDMKIATVSAGYCDGVPRFLSNKGKVGINGRLYNIAGRVCMDQFMVDITGSDGINLYDTAVIFGEGGQTCTQVADMGDTISYEVFCSVNKRVPRIYTE